MRVAVKGDTKSGVQEIDALARRQAAFEQQTIKTNETLKAHAKAHDEAAAAAKRAQQVQQQLVAAQRAAGQGQIDMARRQREALASSAQVTQSNLRQHLDAIEKEKAARLSALDFERRTATTAAERYQIDNRADEVRHQAHLQRVQVERAVQQQQQRMAAQQASQSAALARQAAASQVDAAKREREWLESKGSITQSNLRQHLAAIDREKAARLAQIDVERRTARTTADAYRLANQADQTRHEARMRRLQAERAAQQASSPGAQLATLGGYAAAAGAAAVAADALATRSLQLANVQANLPFSIDKARESTKGLVSDYDLMRQAIAANRLGVAKSSEDFAKAAGIATTLGVSIGKDATQSLDDFVNGLGRASTEVLDNLGITMRAGDAHKLYAERIGKTADDLTDFEKRQAVVTIGIERGAEAASKATVEIDGLAGAWVRAKIAAQNAADAAFSFDDALADLSDEAMLALGLNAREASEATEALGEGLATWSRAGAAVFTMGMSEAHVAIYDYATAADSTAKTIERGKTQYNFIAAFLADQRPLAEQAAAGWRQLSESMAKAGAERRAEDWRKLEQAGEAWMRVGKLAVWAVGQEAAKIEEKRQKEAAKDAKKRIEAARDAMRAELQITIAGAQRELQVAEARNASITERLALIKAVGEAEQALAEKEYQWAQTQADQLRAVASLHASKFAADQARSEALIALEQRARQEFQARVEAEGDAELAGMRRRQEMEAANTGLYRGRNLAKLEPGRVEGAEASNEILRLQEQARANNELRAAEQALLEQRLAGTTEYAERLQIQEQIAQLAHESELERIEVISAIEAKQTEAQRASAVERLETQRHFARTALTMAQSTTTASMGIFRASKAAGEAAKAAGENVARARAKAAGEGLIAFAQDMRGQAVGLGFQAAADLIMGNPIGAARHAGAAAMYAAGSVAVMQIGRGLAGGGGGGGTAGASVPSAGFGGGGSPAADRSGSLPGPIPPSPQPGATPGRVPSPGNPMGGTANAPQRQERGGAKVIHATFNAVSIDRGAAREIRRALRDLAANEG